MDQRQVIDVDNYEPRAIDLTTNTIDLTQDDSSDMDDGWAGRRTTQRMSWTSSGKQMNYYANPSARSGGDNSKRKRLEAEPFFYRYVWPPKKTEHFDLTDGNDEEPGPSKKKHRATDSDMDDEGTDSDGGDYDAYTDGLLMNSNHWKPLPAEKLSDNENTDAEMSEELEILSVEASLRRLESEDVLTEKQQTGRRRTGVPIISMQKPLVAEMQLMGKSLPWDMVNRLANASPWRHPLRRNNYNDVSGLPDVTSQSFKIPKSSCSHHLSLSSSFKQSPGYVMRIIQQDGWAVVCSTCAGGLPDSDDEEEVDAYNRDGSLIIWHDGKEEIMTGHRRKLSSTENRYKHYSVNDIKFDPASTAFVSSGNDRKVRVWKKQEDSDDEEYVQDRVLSFTYVPHEIAFKPGTKKLAIAEKRICIYADYETSATRTSLSVAPQSAEHSVGDMKWGSGPTEHLICASSEPNADDCFEGYHKVFDVEKGTSYELDSKEAGDSMGLTPDGSILVHTSRGPDRKHILRVYDIRRKDGRAVESVHMESFPAGIDGEVNSISISPDGIYVAIARLDNRVHLYDSRMLRRGKVYEYEHKGPNLTNPNCTSGGIMARWVETEDSRLALVTGSVDGCVRLWDPLEAMTSPRNGIVLAQVNSDIGYFSLGDRTKNEQQLMVGDCSGEVYVFSSTKTYLRPL